MKAVLCSDLAQVAGGCARISTTEDGATQIKVTGTSSTVYDGLLFTTTEVILDDVAQPTVFDASGFAYGSYTVFGTHLDNGSLYILRG